MPNDITPCPAPHLETPDACITLCCACPKRNMTSSYVILSHTPPGAKPGIVVLQGIVFSLGRRLLQGPTVFPSSSPAPLVFSLLYPLPSTTTSCSSPFNKVHPFPDCCYCAPFVSRIPYCLYYYHQHHRYDPILKLGGSRKYEK